MNIHFSSFYPSIYLPALKNSMLTVQQKKILLIASAAFVFLTACYLAKSYFSFSVKSLSVPQHILQSDSRVNLYNYLATHGKHIRELDLSTFSTLNDPDLEAISKSCPNLQKLIITSSEVTDKGLQHLQTLTALQSLNLCGCIKITDQGLQYLQTLKALQFLNLFVSHEITDQGMQHLQALKALKSLNLTGCCKITDQGLQYLQVMTTLQSLCLWGCDDITDQGLQYLQALKALQFLDLTACNKITDKGLQCFQVLKTLQFLDLKDCKQLNSHQIQQLQNQMPWLKITT